MTDLQVHSASTADACPYCRNGRDYGCKWGCPEKKPPRDGAARSYEDWADEQEQRWAYEHERHCRSCPSWADELKAIGDSFRRSAAGGAR